MIVKPFLILLNQATGVLITTAIFSAGAPWLLATSEKIGQIFRETVLGFERDSSDASSLSPKQKRQQTDLGKSVVKVENTKAL